MKKFFLLSIFVFFSVAGFAQQAEFLVFKETVFDFGEIVEESGPADHEFKFINNSGRSIRIISVHASCGCTTPGWTQDIIPNGKEGFVKASYNPKGRPGYFNKSLTVTTDVEGSTIALQIKGQVVQQKSERPDELDFSNGNLKLKSNTLNLGKAFINKEPLKKDFSVRNAGVKAIKFIQAIGPSYIRTQMPKSLDPGQAGAITLVFDAASRDQYGFTSDNIQIETDDEEVPLKSFPVYATIEEYFPTLSAEELSRAPVLNLASSTIDFGRLSQSANGQQEIIIKNMGRKELIIRSLQPNCSCVVASLEQMKLKPGAETKLNILFTTQGRKDTQQKALTLYSNDPQNPIQRITIMAYIE